MDPRALHAAGVCEVSLPQTRRPYTPPNSSDSSSPTHLRDTDLSSRHPKPSSRRKDDDLRLAIDLSSRHEHHPVPNAQQQQQQQQPPNVSASPRSIMSSTRPDRIPGLTHRTASIDSTVSSLSSSTTQRPNAANGLRASQDTAAPQDAASLIAAAGSAEAAVQKILAEKQQTNSHNAQLWRLVEKQRAMILGLNKDLEKALKEKERYRKKLKDQLAQSSSAPTLMVGLGRPDELDSQGTSPASSHVEPASNVSRDISVDTRKASDDVEAKKPASARSDTPQDVTNTSVNRHPHTPQSANSLKGSPREAGTEPLRGQPPPIINTSQASPTLITSMLGPRTPQAPPSGVTPVSPQTFSSPKIRKAPPAPLKLNSPISDGVAANDITEASDDLFEEDPESARSEHIDRGRRKTREDDDRQREQLAKEEEEQRSRSKKEKKSKSRASTEKAEAPAPVTQNAPQRQQPAVFEPTANPTEILRQRAISDANGMLQRSITAPSLMSPGLPMSPRPGDRPPNAPMPRAPNANPATKSIPMSPRQGLPLSPRAPRQPIPLPPQTPLAINSPHLDRAKAYHQQAQLQPPPMSNIADRLMPTSEASPENERPSTSSDNFAQSPGEIYRGLVTDEYPGLLLPPNALPSILVKTASSRMKRSRASFIAPKQMEEDPVFTLAVHGRSDNKQLWQVEKTFASLASLDAQIKAICPVHDRIPERALFTGHAPSKIDARRFALNKYFERMLDSVNNENAAILVCKFLSTDAVGGEAGDYFGGSDSRPDSPIIGKLRPTMSGYLTKRGKNFGGWKARFFVVDGPNLKYFENRGGAQLGSIKLQNAQIGKQSPNTGQSSSDDDENQFRHAFLVLEPKKKDSSALVRHVLCAESDEERDKWVETLLQYVDFKDEDEQQHPGRQAQVPKTDITPKSPRLQKSMGDLRLESKHGKDSAQSKSIDHVRTVNYSETVAGEAPVMGGPSSPRMAHTPSPPFESSSSSLTDQSAIAHPAISGPTNLHVIHNGADWGMKPPPTPGGKDKKRGMFSNLPFTRGRSSSDLAPGDNFKASGARAVFGVPLAEAVAFAHPTGTTTELPAVVYRCIEYLTAKNAILEEGIFRLSGSNTVIKALKDRFNVEGDVNLLADENYYDIHAVASLLKLYLRELPSSILTRDLHLDFLGALDLAGDEKVTALNALVHRLPAQNRALMSALSAFMLLIVNNVDQNKMSVRNLGVVFSPTLNLPGPLISLFVEEQHRVFGPLLDANETSSPVSSREGQTPTQTVPSAGDLRSPRHQMFSDLPTPAYNQTHFRPMGNIQDDTGMIPMQPSYAAYQMASQGEGGFGSLNDARRSQTFQAAGPGEQTSRDVKARRRESGMLLMNNMTGGVQKKPSRPRLREVDEQGASF